ncbi:unnamed protein product [Ectocarpus sp. 6 AP-2014]
MPDHDDVADTASTTSSSSYDDNRIKVVCRVRPPVSRETHGARTLAHRCVAVREDKRTVTLNTKPQEKNFTFDYAAGEDSTQEELFSEVGKPVTEACLEGYNGTIFCYGQTGSGKTFTTFGPGAVMENHLTPSDPKSYALRGLVPRVLEYLYANIARQVDNGGGKVSYSCKCSFFEIFNEKVFDLVDESNRDNPMGLTVREDTRKGVYVEGLMEEDVDGVESACEVLHRGFRNRHVGETAMNRESSRSHAVFTLVIQATEVVEEEGLTRSRVARFNLVDLAGSERQKDTQASGERLKEASNINKSLSTLGQVINALVEKSAGRFRHVHYRDSKLTFLLRDSLGGNSKTMLVAALSPADQNFGETLSTLKFAQRAKMIKNQAVKNEDTSGSFDALRREVTTLRQKLAAAQQPGSGGGIPRAITAAGDFLEISGGGEGGTAGAATGGVDGGASEELLVNALRRARAAEEAQAGASRRVESLLAAVEKGEKDALQLKMIIKFRDGTIAAQRKKDSDQERASMADENAHLLKQLEGGVNESAEVSKWRLQCKEAEARLAELTGDNSGDVRRLVWGVGDEERFRGELDEKVLSLVEEKRQLTDAADEFEERLRHESRKAEKRRMSAANRAELEAKKIVENALLSKLQEAQRQAEETHAALAVSEERVAGLETERARQGAAVSALTKQLQDANRREAEAVQDRDVRLADLQSKIGELSEAKERAVTDGGSELASLEVKIVGFIKDNSELLRANKALEEEADALDLNLEQLEAEKKGLEEKAAAERAEAKSAIRSLEERMQQQQEAQERELEDHQAEKRSVMEDLEDVTERLRSAKEAHGKEVDEHQRRSNDLQERLVETRALKGQLEGRLKQVQDDYDTLSEQAHFTQSRAQDLESSLERAADDLRRAVAAGTARACVVQGQLRETEARLCLAEEGLADAELRAEGEEFFKLAQEAISKRAGEVCAERDQRIESLVEELETSRGYADGLRALLSGAEHDERRGLPDGVGAMVGKVETESREAMVGGAVMCREMMEEYETLVDQVCGLEQTLDELVGDEDRLVEEVYGLQYRIEELEENEAAITSDLISTSAQLAAAKADLTSAAEQQVAASNALMDKEKANCNLREELAVAGSTATELKAAKDDLHAEVEKIKGEAQELGVKLEEVRDSCFDYQARAMKAEGSLEGLTADLSEVEEEKAACLSREEALIAAVTASKKTAAANDELVRAKEEELQAVEGDLAARNEELATLQEEFAEVKLEVTTTEERLEETSKRLKEEAERVKNLEEEVTVGRGTVQGLEAKVEGLEEQVKDNKKDLAAAKKDLGAQQKELASAARKLAASEKKAGAAEEALATAEARAKEGRETEAELRGAIAEAEVASKRGIEAAREELGEMEQRLSAEVAKREASEARAEQVDALKAEVEEMVASLGQELVQLREECRRAADRLEESEAVQKVHAGRVIDLKKEVERLQGSTMSEEERRTLVSDVESARLNIAETERMLQVATTRNACLEEEIRAMRGETEGYTAKVMELKDVNASLVGHKNSRQKIQQVQKLKDENNLLSRKVKELDDRLFSIKRSGCGPGCGRNAPGSSTTTTRASSPSAGAGAREGEASTSANSSWAGSQQSVSPTLKSRGGGDMGGGGDKVGSAGKTYNLRRRPKVAEAASNAGAGGVSTRGRRMGLRDMTNAN